MKPDGNRFEDLLLRKEWTLSSDGSVCGGGVPALGRLFYGFGNESLCARCSLWLGDDCLWWVGGDACCTRPFHAIVSSRVGKHPEQHPAWLRFLERALQGAARNEATVLVPHGPPFADWISHAAKLFRVGFVSVDFARAGENIEHWLRRLKERPADEVSVFPLGTHAFDDPPLADRFAIGLADHVTCLHSRPGGHVEHLLERRLTAQQHDIGSVQVGVHTVTIDDASERLMRLGAIGWYFGHAADTAHELDAAHTVDAHACDDRPRVPVENPSLSLEDFLQSRHESLAPDQWPYLVHCTRAADGPWPEESLESWRDRILLRLTSQQSDPLAVLQRIVQQQLLRGSHRTTRGQQKVVCLSALPLPTLLSRRTFRPHLSRWDYEPYGIGIRRSVVAAHGGRPVIYGPAESYADLPEESRAWFQNCGTRYDWSEEQEWRVLDKLRLSEIAPEDMFVFVPNQAAAAQLQRCEIACPVVVVRPERSME